MFCFWRHRQSDDFLQSQACHEVWDLQVTVILEHMFTPAEMEEEPTLREDLEDDIKTECTKMGPVEKVCATTWSPHGGCLFLSRKGQEKLTPLGVITGASEPRSSPRLLPLELQRQQLGKGKVSPFNGYCVVASKG